MIWSKLCGWGHSLRYNQSLAFRVTAAKEMLAELYKHQDLRSGRSD
ncbi:MAG: hypothetical protein LUQ47_02575 [Methanotrichaceae archaeon]|nr:hypothetical protein [Methanotrichaceae archaeon]